MHDEPLDQHTAAFLDEVRAAFGEATPPRPTPELAALFASGLTNDKGDLSVTAASNANGSAPQTSGLPNWTRRHIDMVKDVMEQVRTRAVAAAVGAAVALSGLGASGALNAPLRMISDDSAPTEECVAAPDPATDDGADATEPASDDTVTGDDVTPTEDDTTATGDDNAADCDDAADGTTDDMTDEAVDGTDDGVTDAVEDTDDPTAATEPPAAPTTVSEAAHIHDFDEACGNHGAYVSHFARFGEEPECATTAREGTQGEESGESTPLPAEDAVTDAGDDTGSEDAEAVEPRSRGKGRSAHATTAKGSRGKSRK